MQASPAVSTWSRGIQLGHVVQHEAFHKAVLVRFQELQHLLHLLQGSCLHLNGNVLVLSAHKVLQITHAYTFRKATVVHATRLHKGNRLGDAPTESKIQPHIQTKLPKARGILHQLKYALNVLVTQVTSSEHQLERRLFRAYKGQDGMSIVVKLLLDANNHSEGKPVHVGWQV